MDRHPENYLARSKSAGWWRKERIIGLIDFDVVEDPIPLSCESANLLAYVPVFSDRQVKQAVDIIERWFNNGSSTPLVKGALQRAHPLGVIQRGIDLNGAWSTESRRSLWPYRHPLWAYAHRQIAMVYRDNPVFFNAYSRQFKGIDHVFGMICAGLKAHDDTQT